MLLHHGDILAHVSLQRDGVLAQDVRNGPPDE